MHPANLFASRSELPENVFVHSTNFSLHYNESLAGNVKAQFMNSTTPADEDLQPHISLMEALASLFSCMNNCYESYLLAV